MAYLDPCQKKASRKLTARPDWLDVDMTGSGCEASVSCALVARRLPFMQNCVRVSVAVDRPTWWHCRSHSISGSTSGSKCPFFTSISWCCAAFKLSVFLSHDQRSLPTCVFDWFAKKLLLNEFWDAKSGHWQWNVSQPEDVWLSFYRSEQIHESNLPETIEKLKTELNWNKVNDPCRTLVIDTVVHAFSNLYQPKIIAEG